MIKSHSTRFLRMVRLLAAGEITIRSFRMGLRMHQVAVCRKAGGMVFCDAAVEREYFWPDVVVPSR